MSLPLRVESMTNRGILKLSVLSPSRLFVSKPRVSLIPTIVRLASRISKSQSSSQRPSSRSEKQSISAAEKRQIDASRKAALLVKRLNKTLKTLPQAASKPAVVPEVEHIDSKFKHHKGESEALSGEQPARGKQALLLRRIVEDQRKLLWPGIWYIVAITSTYSLFAYLDARTQETNPIAIASHLPDQIPLPQSWFLTPTVIKEGLIAGWNELDNLTIGIVVVCVSVHFLKRSPLPIWERLMHITGEKKWTSFTYPLVHNNWAHVASNMYAIVWFLPTVNRYFDNDLFHTTAFLVSIPLITSYLQHFWFRWVTGKAIVANAGASGAAGAVFGVFCMLYPDEKVWMPSFVILRLDAKYLGLIWLLHQIWSVRRTSLRGNSQAQIVHLASFGIGLAYTYFNGKDNIWKPLLATFSKEVASVPSE